MRILLLLPLFMTSCVVANGNMVASMGGKFAYKGKDFGIISDHEGSFRDAAVLAGLAVGAWQTVAATKAAEATKQVASSNATKQAINASNNTTAEVLGAQKTSVELAKIPK